MSLFGIGLGPRRRRRRTPLTSRRDLTTIAPVAVPAMSAITAPVGSDQVGKVLTADGTGQAVWVEPTVNTTVVTPVASTTSTTISPVGTVSMWMGVDAPSGWLMLNGQTFDKAVYPKLYAVLGNNATLPDMRGRFPLGKADIGTGSTILGTGGALDHTHSAAKHTHPMGAHTHTTPSATVSTATASGAEVDKLSLLGILGTKAAGMAHNHSVTIPANTTGISSGTTGENADGNTGTGNPAFLALTFIVKAV